MRQSSPFMQKRHRICQAGVTRGCSRSLRNKPIDFWQGWIRKHIAKNCNPRSAIQARPDQAVGFRFDISSNIFQYYSRQISWSVFLQFRSGNSENISIENRNWNRNLFWERFKKNRKGLWKTSQDWIWKHIAKDWNPYLAIQAHRIRRAVFSTTGSE